MHLRNSQAQQSLLMLRRRIAFIVRKAVAGILLVELAQEPVAMDFGDDAGSGDGKAARVTLNDGGLTAAERGAEIYFLVAVDQKMIRFVARAAQALACNLHGQ